MKKYVFITLMLFLSSFTLNPFPKVYVEWVDIIATDSGWHSREDVDYWIENESDTVKQIGFLYRDTKGYVVLVDSFITPSYLGAATKIPKGNIIKIKRLP